MKAAAAASSGSSAPSAPNSPCAGRWVRVDWRWSQTATTIELSDGAGQPLNGEAARAELERRLGVKLPLAELRYWMLGVPAPARAGQRARADQHGFGARVRPGRLGRQL